MDIFIVIFLISTFASVITSYMNIVKTVYESAE